MYQATLYQYNQRSEILIPERRGTTYLGPDNHKPLVLYRGLNIEFDFFVRNTDRKPQTLHNKTYEAYILDNGRQVFRKTLTPVDYDNGILVLKLDHEETLQLDVKLYDIVITYKDLNNAGNWPGTSDQNMRATYVLEVKDALLTVQDSDTVTAFSQNGSDFEGSRMTGPALTYNKTGSQTAQINFTNYTGVYKFQGTLSLQPLSTDWFDVPSQSYTVSAKSGISYHHFIGQYTYVRLVHTPDPSNTGTLDKVVYRA